MSQPATRIFGRGYPAEPHLMTNQGQTGWWSVPGTWYCKPFIAENGEWSGNQLTVSPNADFSPPVYVAEIGDDLQTFVFQDLWRDKQLGILP